MPWIILIIILTFGFVLRVCLGLDWDEGQHLHPDERFLTMVVSAIKMPSSIAEYFDSSKSLLSPYNNNYGFFVYGTFPLFFTKLVSLIFSKDGYDQVHIVGRILSSLFDLGSVLLLFFTGKRLYSTTVGLVSAALLAFTVLNIQLSHFFGVETYASFFVLLTFYLATYTNQFFEVSARVLPKQGYIRTLLIYMLMGLSFGLALASKISAIFFLPVLGFMFVGGFVRKLVRRESLEEIFSRSSIFEYSRAIIAYLFVILLAGIFFRIFQPYAFAGPTFFDFQFNPKFLSNMKEVSGMMNGADMPPSIQWIGRPAFWFSFYNMVVWGMGVVLGLACWFGALLAIYQVIFRRVYQHFYLIFWALFWFTYQSSQFVKAGRYLSIVYPFFILLGAYFLVWLGNFISQLSWSKNKSVSFKNVIRLSPALAGVFFTFLWSIAFVNIYSSKHSRVAASYWIYDKIPCGATLAGEHWDDGLPLRVGGKDGFGGCYKGIEFNHYYPDNPEKFEDTLKKLNQADYIIISSNRLYLSIPRLPRRFPYTIEYYNMLFSGELGFDLVYSESSYPGIFGIKFPTDNAEEPFTVYDHPRVFIFKKSASFNLKSIRDRLSKFPPGLMEPLV